MKTLKIVAVVIVVAALVFSCTVTDEPEAYGTLVIKSSGGSSRTVTGNVDPVFDSIKDDLTFEFDISNEETDATVGPYGPYEVDTTHDVSIQLVPGTWVVAVKVYQKLVQQDDGKTTEYNEIVGSAKYDPVTINAGETTTLGKIDVPTSPYGKAIAHKITGDDPAGIAFVENDGYQNATDPYWQNAYTVNIDRYMRLLSNGNVDTVQPSNYDNNGRVSPHGTAKILWDESYIYVLVLVKDAALTGNTGSGLNSGAHVSDSVEIFFKEDGNGDRTKGNQYRIDYSGKTKSHATPTGTSNSTSSKFPDDKVYLDVSRDIPDGVSYAVVARIKHSKGSEGGTIGIDFQINGAPLTNGGIRSSVAVWYDKLAIAWKNGTTYEGTLTLY